MKYEQDLITIQTEFPSRMMEDVYGTLTETAPLYRAGLKKFVTVMQQESSEPLLAGWGVRNSEGTVILPELFSGRGFCDVGTRLLGALLRFKYPTLCIDVREGYALSYDEPDRPRTQNGLDIFHSWAVLSDPETLDTPPVSRNIFTLDPTAKQLNPRLPFILYSHQDYPDVSLYNSDFESLDLNLCDLNVVKRLLLFSADSNTRAKQEKAFRDFVESLKITI